MSNWVEELGQKKMTDKELRLISKVFALMSELDEDMDNEDSLEFNEFMGKTIDIAIYNLTKLKEVVKLEVKNG